MTSSPTRYRPGVVDQAGYVVRGCVCGDTQDQRFALASSLRFVIEAVSGATELRDEIQALDEADEYMAAARALELSEVTPSLRDFDLPATASLVGGAVVVVLGAMPCDSASTIKPQGPLRRSREFGVELVV